MVQGVLHSVFAAPTIVTVGSGGAFTVELGLDAAEFVNALGTAVDNGQSLVEWLRARGFAMRDVRYAEQKTTFVMSPTGTHITG